MSVTSAYSVTVFIDFVEVPRKRVALIRLYASASLRHIAVIATEAVEVSLTLKHR